MFYERLQRDILVVLYKKDLCEMNRSAGLLAQSYEPVQYAPLSQFESDK